MRVLVREREEEGMHWAVSTRKKRRRFCSGLLNSSGQGPAQRSRGFRFASGHALAVPFGVGRLCICCQRREARARKGIEDDSPACAMGVAWHRHGPACTDDLADAVTGNHFVRCGVAGGWC